MRLAAQMKLGFYPAHAKAIHALAAHLQAPATGVVNLIDPCAGRGEAALQLARALGIQPPNVYCVELDACRAEAIREAQPDARVLGPASFMGTRITGDSFSLAYVNPPFDDEIGGGRREEQAFAELAASKLVVGGVLVLVMPFGAISGNYSFKQFLDQIFEDGAFYCFPEDVRKFNEIVFIARKRARLIPQPRDGAALAAKWYPNDPANFPALGTDGRTWQVPAGRTPGRFEKIKLTEAEMTEMVNSSRLLSIFDPPVEPEIARPPLPPYTGHVAQLLAAGMLNGVVNAPGEPPHVVRGTADKVDVRESIEPLLNADGDKIGEREQWVQVIQLTVRVIGLDAVIKTFASMGKGA